jgi:uncharacterized protein (UPF0297 family)
MEDSNTTVFNIGVLREKLILLVLNEVITTLKENGYNPVNQIVGYLTTGDLCYITSKGNARNKIARFTREEVLKAIIKGYLEK